MVTDTFNVESDGSLVECPGSHKLTKNPMLRYFKVNTSVM